MASASSERLPVHSPTALYGPMGNFRYALEARAGFYESQGARQGEARLLIPAAK